jgi:hypothetical protein
MNDDRVKGQLFTLRSFHLFRVHVYNNDRPTTYKMSTIVAEYGKSMERVIESHSI